MHAPEVAAHAPHTSIRVLHLKTLTRRGWFHQGRPSGTQDACRWFVGSSFCRLLQSWALCLLSRSALTLSSDASLAATWEPTPVTQGPAVGRCLPANREGATARARTGPTPFSSLASSSGGAGALAARLLAGRCTSRLEESTVHSLQRHHPCHSQFPLGAVCPEVR